MKYVIASYTSTGINRECNQDNFYIGKSNKRKFPAVLAVLCDGMGGYSQGEVASEIAIESFTDWFIKKQAVEKKSPDLNGITEEWKDLVVSVNNKIYFQSQKQNQKMGTTLSALLILKNQYIAVHVGDTRIYRINQKVRQITEDHTVVAKEVMEGKITQEQANNDRRRNLLTRSLGVLPVVKPQIIAGKVEKQDGFLMCSDGFWHKVKESEMITLLDDKKHMERNLESLGKALRERKEKDDVSAIIIAQNKCALFLR